jgi:predicted nucleic acid-binding protein
MTAPGVFPTELVDTNVLGELSRKRPHPGVLTWAATARRVALSVITVEEILYGLARHPIGRVGIWFDQFLARHCEVLDITKPIAVLAGTMRGQLASRGQVRSQADILIAATAAHHGLTLVTRNVRDFDRCGVQVFNPFSR